MVESDYVLLVVIGLTFVAFLVKLLSDQRWRAEEIRSKREADQRAHELALAELEARTQDQNPTPYFAWREGPSASWPTHEFTASRPKLAGDYLTLTFNEGAQPTDAEFGKAVLDALELPYLIGALGGLEREDLEVRVERATFENPLVLTIVIGTSALAASGGLVLLFANARRISNVINHMRRDWWSTSRDSAADKAAAATSQRRQQLDRALTDALDIEDDGERDRRLEVITQISRIAAEHDLRSLAHSEVPSLERVRSDSPILRSLPHATEEGRS